MKRSVVLFAVDSADIPVAIRCYDGAIFPIRDLSALDEPRAIAQKLGVDTFGEEFSIAQSQKIGHLESKRSGHLKNLANSALNCINQR